MTPTRRKVVFATLVAILLVAGVVWVADGRRTQATQPNVEATSAQPVGPTKVESKCGLQGTPGTPTVLRSTWENVAGWSLPISITDGPGIRSPTGPWSCYARTPAGAVLAGYVIPLRVDGLAEDWKTVVKQQTVPGPAQAAKLALTPPQASEKATVKGFQVTAYSDTRATISYYFQTPTLAATCAVDLAWVNQDWRLKLQDNGDTFSGCSQGVPPSFVPWGPT